MYGLFFIGVTLAVSFSNLVKSEERNCPSDEWKRFGCSCYLVASPNKPLNWTAANETCNSINKASHLATIRKKDEDNFLGEHIKDESWIGLRGEGNSTFQWINGERKLTYAVRKKELSTPGSETKCVAAKSTNHGTWVAQSCSQRHRFICETPTVNDACPDKSELFSEWKKLKTSCYASNSSMHNFTSSRYLCSRNLTIALAEITTKEQLDFLKETFNSKNEIIWFGLEKPVNASKFRYTSSKNEPNYKAIGVWQKGFNRKGASCVGLKVETDEVSWLKKPCGEIRNYICETEANRDFYFTILNVNETSANVSWQLSNQPESCDQLSPNAIYKLFLKEKNSSPASRSFEPIENPKTRSKVFTNLRPATTYTVTMIETLKASGRRRKSSHDFTTSEIANPLTLMSNISSQSVKANLNDKVNLLCTVKGEPRITFWWEKDRKTIKSFAELQKPFPSSLLLVDLKNSESFGKYICHIEDRFSNKSHEILVEAFSKDDDDDGKQQFMIATIVLAILLLILLVVTGYLIHRANQKKGAKLTSFKETKSKDATSRVTQTAKDTTDPNSSSGPFEMYANVSNNPANVTEELGTDMAEYTALQRPDVETNEEEYYTHLKDDQPVYENTRDIGV